jgi:fatty acid desaturase
MELNIGFVVREGVRKENKIAQVLASILLALSVGLIVLGLFYGAYISLIPSVCALLFCIIGLKRNGENDYIFAINRYSCNWLYVADSLLALIMLVANGWNHNITFLIVWILLLVWSVLQAISSIKIDDIEWEEDEEETKLVAE